MGVEAAAHATALGKALLTTMDGRVRRPVLAEQGMRPFTRCTPPRRDSSLALGASARGLSLPSPLLTERLLVISNDSATCVCAPSPAVGFGGGALATADARHGTLLFRVECGYLRAVAASAAKEGP